MEDEVVETWIIKDVAPAPAPVVTPATKGKAPKSAPSKGIFDEIDAELAMALPTVESRRFRDIYWACYRLMRRDVRNKWYSQTKNISSIADELPAYSTFSISGELVFDSDKFREEFETKFGTAESRKYSAEDFLSLAKRFWKEGRDEVTLVNWLKEDYRNFQEVKNRLGKKDNVVGFDTFKEAFAGHEVDGLF